MKTLSHKAHTTIALAFPPYLDRRAHTVNRRGYRAIIL